MNAGERKERLAYLWRQARRYFWQQVIVTRMSRAYQQEKEPVLIDEDDLLHTQAQADADPGKWYLINEKKTLP